MKAVHYEGPFKVSVKEIPKPKLQHPDDAIIKVTTSGRLLLKDVWKSVITDFHFSNLRIRFAHVSRQNSSRIRPRFRVVSFAPFLTTPLMTSSHENMGIVEEIGEGVTLLKKGDRIVLPFNVADGRCQNCEEGKTAFCTGVNPGFAGGAYGYVAMGPYQGGQAQWLRVPYADFNALK